MNICVVVRFAPDPEGTVRPARDGLLDLGGMPPVPNPFDMSAVEAAIALKEQGQAGNVTVVSTGGAEVEDLLHLSRAMGADRVVRVATPGPERLSPRSAALALAGFVQGQDFSLVLLGRHVSGDESGQLAYQLASVLDRPVATGVMDLALSAGFALVTRRLSRGFREELQLSLPAVLAVEQDVATARYVGRGAIARARREDVELSTSQEWVAFVENGCEGSCTPVFRRPNPAAMFVPDVTQSALDRLEQVVSGGLSERSGRLLAGSPSQIAVKLADFFEESVGLRRTP